MLPIHALILLACWMMSVVQCNSVFDIMKSPVPLFRIPNGFNSAWRAKSAISAPIKAVARTPKPGRLQKELSILLTDIPSECKVTSVSSNFREWQIRIYGPRDSLFANEQFLLRIKYPFEYPYKPPVVYFEKGFVPNPTGGSPEAVGIPKHPHIYSNGDICLSVLGKDWRPGMSTESIVVSILSLLTSAKTKRLPEDDRIHSEFNFPGQEQKNWQYHDSNV
jgi:ubiquitin-conjugating enzyme E2 W